MKEKPDPALVFLLSMLILGMFFPNVGSAITCTICSELISRDPTFPIPVDPSQIPCSNPGEMVCGEGVTSCMTTTVTMHFSRDAGKNIMPVAHKAFFRLRHYHI